MENNIGIADLFVVLFVGLKLGHVIDWSWWGVFFPYYIGVGVTILAAILAKVAD